MTNLQAKLKRAFDHHWLSTSVVLSPCALLFSVALLVSVAQAQAPWPQEDPDGWGLAIIDVETTGLDPQFHEMVDVGAIYTTLEGEELGRFFVRIHPKHPDRAGEIARSINGYDEARWEALEALMPDEAVDRFVAFHQEHAKDRRFVLTAYNAPFDRNFLEALLKRHEHSLSDFYTYFVLDLPSMAFGLGVDALVNAEVAKAFGLPPETSDPLEHTGLSGAEWNLALYRAMRESAKDKGMTFPATASAIEPKFGAEPKETSLEWLFVHTANMAEQVDDRIFSVSIDRPILAFTDRPQRRVKHLAAEEFVAFWTHDQADGFGQDPPNAVISWVSDGQIHQAEAEVLDAVFDEVHARIHYTLSKPLRPYTTTHSDVSMFFDAMPTPVNGQITQSDHSDKDRLERVSIFFDGMPVGMDAYLF